ncbi:MAG: hypothetical protein ACYC9O_06555 [Candidatus Latescibacterota bacterium]
MTPFRGILSITLCLAILLSPVSAFCDEASNPESPDPVNYYKLGRDIARQQYSFGKAFGTGLAVGFLLPAASLTLVGLPGIPYTSIAVPILGGPNAYFMSVKVPEKYVLSLPYTQQEQFTAGYTKTVRTKRTYAYVIGNIIGSATLIAIIIGSIDWSTLGTT